MKGIMASLGRVFKGFANALLSPAEDPRQSFAYTYQHQHDLLEKVQVALSYLKVAAENLEDQTNNTRSKLTQLENQARQALVAGQEDVARLVLEHRQLALREFKALEEQIRDTKQEQKRLSIIEKRLSAQIDDYFARQEIAAARQSAAEAKIVIRDTLSDVARELGELDVALKDAESKTANMQARALEIDRQLNVDVLERDAKSTDTSTLESEIAKTVDSQIEVLKREVDTHGRGPSH